MAIYDILTRKSEGINALRTATFLAPLPGIARTQTAIAEELEFMGVKTRVLKKFPKKHLPTDLLLISTTRQKEIDEIGLYRNINPKLKVGFIEQTEEDVKRNSLSLNAISPEFIFTVSNDSLRVAMTSMPDYKGIIYPVGNAEFDDLLKLNLKNNRKRVRNSLKINESDVVVSYIGRPPGVIYGNPNPETRKDVNSNVFVQLFIGLCIIADQLPNIKFQYLNLPHPAENQLYYLENLKLNMEQQALPPNLNLINLTPKRQNKLNLKSLEICSASDLVTTIRSSLGIQTSLLGTLDHDEQTPLTLHILFRENEQFLEDEAQPRKMSPLIYKAAPYVREPTELVSALYQSLFNKKLKEIVFNNQTALAKNYHFGEKSVAKRAAFFINLFNQYSGILSGFHNTAFSDLNLFA